MSTILDWQTEEDDDWESQPVSEEMPGPGRRGWLALLLFLLTLGLAGAAVYQHLVRRADATTAAVARDVLATHHLFLRTLAQADAELFGSLLAAQRHPAWAQRQRELFDRDLFLDRPFFGLRAESGGPLLPVLDYQLSPDLQQAKVQFEQAYHLDWLADQAQTVNLRHSTFYRLQGARWLAVPPEDSFWGQWLTNEGQLLTVTYPARDQEIANRLTLNLRNRLRVTCLGLQNIHCPGDLHVRLRLETDPVSLLQAGGVPPTSRWAGSSEIVLPTPTLVGLPVDEAGYQALFQGYASRVVGIVLAQTAGVSLPHADALPARVHQAWLDNQLIQFELRPWLGQATLGGAFSGATRARPWPEQQVQLLCDPATNSFHRYDPATGSWSRQAWTDGPSYNLMSSLPARRGLILQGWSNENGSLHSRVTLSRNEAETPLFEGILPSTSMSSLFGWSDPLASKLLLYVRLGDGNPPPYTIVDLDTCDRKGCSMTPVRGLPIWSPDGSRTIVVSRGRLFHGDANGQLLDANGRLLGEIGLGVTPFWLDEKIYGYVRWQPIPQVVVAAVDRDQPEFSLPSDALLAALPAEQRPEQFSISQVGVNPTDTNLLAVALLDFSKQITHFFLYDRATGELSSRLQVHFAVFRYPARFFSPDGRWLVAVSSGRGNTPRTLYLHDIGRNETISYPISFVDSFRPSFIGYEWSADGQWLLTLNAGVLNLIDPAHNYQQMVLPPASGCTFAAWVDP